LREHRRSASTRYSRGLIDEGLCRSTAASIASASIPSNEAFEARTLELDSPADVGEDAFLVLNFGGTGAGALSRLLVDDIELSSASSFYRRCCEAFP
jgi:hypothetical protein